jgi:hypothetical protein
MPISVPTLPREVFVRIDPARTNAAALRLNDSVPAIIPLIIRLHPARTDEAIEDFELSYNPIQIRYGNLADEITQIPRPTTTPIIAFRQHRLLTVDFSFVLAQPGDGLSTSMDDRIQTLRKFAASGHRVVSLLNFDALTTRPYQYRNLSPEIRTDGLFFNIAELGIESTRRNRSNQISQANVSISLVENRNPRITVAFIAPLLETSQQPKCKGNKVRNKEGKCVRRSGDDTTGTPSTSNDDILTRLATTADRIVDSTNNSMFCNFEESITNTQGSAADRRVNVKIKDCSGKRRPPK